jgi:hypothetical protein
MLSWLRNRHSIKLGGRMRGVTLADSSMQNYNGMFTFHSLDAYRIPELGLSDGLTPQAIRALGGGTSQFSITAGIPTADVSQMDAGLFFQEEWRMRPELTLTAGMRYEVQNNIGDRRSFAPRIAIAWARGGRGGRGPLAVIRGGFGMFYDRVSESLTLQARHLDGVRQSPLRGGRPGLLPKHPVRRCPCR